MGERIAATLNRMEEPVRFLIPEGNVSPLDVPGKPCWHPAADRALFAAIEAKFRAISRGRLIKLAHDINDPEFVQTLADQFHEITARRVTSAPGR